MSHIHTVAIIGAGVAGLSAAGLLSRKGLKVKLFEANDKLGGCCGTTTLDGFTFNDGALYLALPGILESVFEKIGLDRPSCLPLRKVTATQTTALPDGTVVSFREGLDVSIKNRSVVQKTLQKELEGMMRKWEPALRLFCEKIIPQPFSLSRLIVEGWPHLPKFRGTVATELRKLFSDEAVQAAMSGMLLYTGKPPERMPVTSILALVAMFSEGIYLPVGGMGKIPEAMSQSLLANGGEIHLNSKVARIVTQNGRVCGVEVQGLGLVEADAVLSTVSGMLTFGSLLSTREVPGSITRKIRKAPLSHRAFAVQLGLSNKIDAPSHSQCTLPWLEAQSQVFVPETGEVKWPIYSVPTVTMPELAPAGGSVIEMYPPINQELPVEAWNEEKKAVLLESAIQTLSRLHKMEIVVKRAVSPQDFQSRLHLYQGAVYGLSPTASPFTQFSHQSPLPGLYQAGQTTHPGYGVGSAAMSGILAAEALMKQEAV